ncbi:MAG: DsbE family thiol:disulfide interchange protein [Inquilinus sp.]|nr:DsbE family thiol:disulfide interchange protein [Inquilinus sp.]
MRRLLYLLPLAVFGAVVAWMAVPLITGDDPRDLPSALIDRPAPDFALPGLPPADGLATADLGGEVVLVNFFASWCVPCLAEHPLLTRLAREEGIIIHAVNYKDAPEAATGWLVRHGNPYARIGADRDGRVGIEWGVSGVPETFVVDRDGRIRKRYTGPLTPAQVEAELLPLLRELGR